jgi:type IV secretion system protein VirD4
VTLWVLLVGVLSLVTAALVAWRLVFGALFAVALWMIGLAVLLGSLPAEAAGHRYWALLLGAGLLILTWPLAAIRQRRTGSRGVVRRWSRRARRNDGVASRLQILRTVSRFAVRRRAIVLRPSLGSVSRWQRLRMPTKAVATRLARVGLFGVWSPIEDVTLRIGGPRTGKSGELAGRILDAQGAVIATSTRTDLVELTGQLRAEVGPVGVFNPSGLAGLPSTITFDPLSGCRKPKTATERAADLLAGVATPGQAGGDRDFWAGQARRVLAALLHAAALGGLTMRDWSGSLTRTPLRRRCSGCCAVRPSRATRQTRCSSLLPTSEPGPASAPRSCLPSAGSPTPTLPRPLGLVTSTSLGSSTSGERCTCSAPRTRRQRRW